MLNDINQNNRRNNHAKWALILFVPAPSVGVLLALHMGQGTLGAILWALAKIWLFFGPLLWLLFIEKSRLSLSPVKKGGLLVGTLIGIGMMLIIWLAYLLFARGNVDVGNFYTKLSVVGLTSIGYYLTISIYWTFINSLLEEYVFRFFIFRQSEQIWSAKIALIMTALFFTIHHTLALAAYVPLWQNILASTGVFIASIIWSWLYAHYRSIWPAYICHIFADIAVFSIGWDILF
ncbi:lysostaphin resistance A-like protein [Neisseria sp. Ec49-e6-T10]|uniref:CPBP family intramembrane glutamic endopeptidase n=1 Tax=Neisseria sp. Ec49-e6-T10 TaxID=3140744 RepID=UPI003EB9D215